MSEIDRVLSRHIVKNEEPKEKADVLRDLEEISGQVNELEAKVKRDLVLALVGLEVSMLQLEVRLRLWALREHGGPEQPKKIENLADLEKALRGNN